MPVLLNGKEALNDTWKSVRDSLMLYVRDSGEEMRELEKALKWAA